MTVDLRSLLPWPEPKLIGDDDGADCTVDIDGHRFVVAPTADIGINSGRMRWRVTCATCGCEVHPGSTSAKAQIARHLADAKADRIAAAAHDLLAVARLAIEVLALQRTYFRTRAQSDLIASKQAESRLAKMATAAVSRVDVP